jgi:hypothetical protein
MSLVDFMQKLQEQDDSDVIYSTPPEPTIRVIPPEKHNNSIKIVPPEHSIDVNDEVEEPVKQPTKIKLKLSKNIIAKTDTVQQSDNTNSGNNINNNTGTTTETANAVNNVVEPPIQPEVVENTTVKEVPEHKEEPVVEPPKTRELTEQEKIDNLFISSGTELSKKAIWVDYYKQALSSRKKNVIVDRMRIGRFTITPDNKVLILPDYDIVGKDPDDVLKDKWF